MNGKHLSERFREVMLDGAFVAGTNFKAQLSVVQWEQAIQQIGPLNTIAVLTSHIHYYIAGVLEVLEGGTLNIKDKYSFDFPLITSQLDWENVLEKLWLDAGKFAVAVSPMSEQALNEDFSGKKYGTYQRNIDAMIEHCYYHLGQIVLIKKLIAATNKE